VEEGIEEAAEAERIQMEGYNLKIFRIDWDVLIKTVFLVDIYEVFTHFQFYFTDYKTNRPHPRLHVRIP